MFNAFKPTRTVELLILPDHKEVVLEHLPEVKMRGHGNTVAVTIGCRPRRRRRNRGKPIDWVVDPRFQALMDIDKVHILHSFEPQLQDTNV